MSRARELAGFATATNPIQDLNVGVVTAISFSGDGSSLTGIDATSIKDGDGTVRAQANTSGVVVTGIITATSLEGDGSALTGLPAGLGTAVSATGDGANVYYTNQVLDLASNLSIDVPATAVVAYTQYPEVAVASGIDLTIADGDDFVADILGIGTTGAPQTLAGGGGRMRADNFTDRGGYNAPTFPNGVSVTGVVTATSSVQVSSGGTFGSNGASAAVYYGDGSNLTGLPALTGSTNNTIVTVTGANALAGESQLTYDGTILQLRKNGAGEYNEIICDGNPSSDRGSLGLISGYWDGDRVADIIFSAGDDTSNKNNGIIQFRTAQEGGGNITQRLQIGSQGQIGLNPNNTVGVAATDYGSDGQVLTSKGGSASPQWVDAAGGEWTLLGSSSGDISNGTNEIDITTSLITSTYYRYKVVFNINCDSDIASGKIGFRFRLNSAWESASYYRTAYRNDSGTMTAAYMDRCSLIEDDIRTLTGEMIIWNPSTGSNRPHDITMHGYALNNRNLINSSGYWSGTSLIQIDQNDGTNYPITGIQFSTQRTIVDYNSESAQRTFWVLYGAKT